MSTSLKELIKAQLSSKFSKDTVWLMIAQGIVMIVGLLINLLIGVYYGMDQLGYFSQSLSYYMILSSIFTLGMHNTLTKKIAENTRGRVEENLLFTSNISTTFVVSSLLTCFFSVLFALNEHWFSGATVAKIVQIHLLAVPFFCTNKCFAAYYSGKRNQFQFSLQRLLRWTTIGGGVIIMVWKRVDLSGVMYLFLITEVILFVYNIMLRWYNFDFTFKWSSVIENVSFGFKSFIAEFIAVLNTYFDPILLAFLLTDAELGKYSFMVFFIRTLMVFPGILMQNLNPIISRLWIERKLEQLSNQIQVIRKLNVRVVAAQYAFMFLAYWGITILSDEHLTLSLPFYLTGSLGVFLFACISWSGGMLIMTGKLKENILRTFTIILLSFASTVLLGFFFGITGACIALSVNGMIHFFLTQGFIYKVLGIRII